MHDLELYKGLSARNDDVWFKAMTAINGVPTRRVRVENPPPYRTIAGTHQTALWHDNSQGLTDGAIRAVVEHFGLTEIIHDSRRPRDEDQIK